MAIQKAGTGIIFIQRSKIEIYSPALGNVIQFPFTPSAVRDLEVLNTEELKTSLRTLITTSKMPVSSLIIVLANNTLYEHDFVENPQVSSEPQIQKYIDNVPFEETSVKRFPIDKGVKVVVANRYLFETIKKVFDALGFSISTVLPAQVFGQVAALDSNSISTILHKLESVKQHNMLETAQPSIAATVQETAEKKKKNKILLIAVIVLFSLSFVLIAVAIAPVLPRFFSH
jgi:hypothetical protein